MLCSVSILVMCAQEHGVEPHPAHPRTIAPLRLWRRRGAFAIPDDSVKYVTGRGKQANLAKPMYGSGKAWWRRCRIP